MDPLQERQLMMTRRQFFSRARLGIGTAVLASLLSPRGLFEHAGAATASPLPHFQPRAKRVIYLFQSGGPAQIDLFDYKPHLKNMHGRELPDSVRAGQKLTTMTAGQGSFPVASSMFQFRQRGTGGLWVSELLPYTGEVADDLCIIRSVYTDAINHDPAITYFQTGFQRAGQPSMGAWLSYGLGSENENLPAFVVMLSQGSGRGGQPLYDRLWGSGFLPGRHQGVKFRPGDDPVLYLSNPPGVSARHRRHMLNDVAEINRMKLQEFGDPDIAARIAQYELAYRMQMAVPDLTDLSDEPEHTFELYGPDSRKPGSFAANCLLARRLAERGVRFIELFHRGWDQHKRLPKEIRRQCADTDQPAAALIKDLKQRGLLDDTLVVWGGEFGRTVYCQGTLTADNYGRDHHPGCFTVWMAGGGIRGGMAYGKTDDFSYSIVENPVSVHDLHATILHQLGIDHERLTFRYQGREFRLTDVGGKVIDAVLA